MDWQISLVLSRRKRASKDCLGTGNIFTSRQRSCEKVMFSLVSVILSKEGVGIPGSMPFPGEVISGPWSLLGVGIPDTRSLLGGGHVYGEGMSRGGHTPPPRDMDSGNGCIQGVATPLLPETWELGNGYVQGVYSLLATHT